MVGITKLLCGISQWGDALRYGGKDSRESLAERRPIVVWNSTRRCNLRCAHCYIDAETGPQSGELSTAEATTLIDDLAAFGAPVFLFSGGEPLLRKDLLELGAYVVSKGMRAVISSNGVLIDAAAAKGIKAAGFSYVGISLDGMEEKNDRFRGKRGAFQEALEGMRNCRAAGVKVGLRFTINKHNIADLPAVLNLLEEEKIPRACFYHLVYAGRGSKMRDEDLSLAESRQAVDLICDKAVDFYKRNLDIEILTVDNHCDGVYLLQKLRREDPERALKVEELLRRNGGNLSGVGIASIDPLGNVHADQFWQHYSFGNVRERPFSEIWLDTSDPIMAGLKNRKPLLKGRCGACKFLDLCNGNLRIRAEAVYGDIWAPDPACYLSDEEIGI
jgi:radical SAM protein with 4Fe4S-binding SPASM domain